MASACPTRCERISIGNAPLNLGHEVISLTRCPRSGESSHVAALFLRAAVAIALGSPDMTDLTPRRPRAQDISVLVSILALTEGEMRVRDHPAFAEELPDWII